MSKADKNLTDIYFNVNYDNLFLDDDGMISAYCCSEMYNNIYVSIKLSDIDKVIKENKQTD